MHILVSHLFLTRRTRVSVSDNFSLTLVRPGLAAVSVDRDVRGGEKRGAKYDLEHHGEKTRRTYPTHRQAMMPAVQSHGDELASARLHIQKHVLD